MSGFGPWPPVASHYAGRIDTLFWAMTAVTGTVALGVFVLLIVFCLRFREAAVLDRRSGSDAAASKRRLVLETVWITVPLLIFLAFFCWAAVLYFRYDTPPAKTLEVYVVAKQWMWTLEHANGQREINELHVPRDRAVKLIMTSQDVIHSFFVPAFRVKRDVVPGRYAVLWFEPTTVGRFHLFCAEYCGTDHSRMQGSVIVMEPGDYAHWLESGAPGRSLASRGAEKFRAFGCSGCHGANAAIRAPSLANLYGRTIPLADGRFVKVDERYVRDSILLPSRDIAAGYSNEMPSFATSASEQDVIELVAYIKSLAASDAGSVPEGRTP